MNNQSVKKRQTFSIDLKIGKKILKLTVQQEDDIYSLCKKLCKSANIDRSNEQKYLMKLKGALNGIYLDTKLSQSIKNKVRKLLNHKSGNNIQVAKNQLNESTETPFKILQDSLNVAKVKDLYQNKRNFRYDIDSHWPSIEQQRINLQNNLRKDKSKDKNEQREEKVNDTVIRSKSMGSYRYYPQQPRSSRNVNIAGINDNKQIGNEQNDEDILMKKYKQLDKRCEQYIIKNINPDKVFKSISTGRGQSANQNFVRGSMHSINYQILRQQLRTPKLQYTQLRQNKQNMTKYVKYDYRDLKKQGQQIKYSKNLKMQDNENFQPQSYKVVRSKSQNLTVRNTQRYVPRPLQAINQNISYNFSKESHKDKYSNVYLDSKLNLPSHNNSNRSAYSSPYDILKQTSLLAANIQTVNDRQFRKKGTKKYNYLANQI